MYRIALIVPYSKNSSSKLEYVSKENLGVGYLAAYLEAKGYEVEMLNADAKQWDNEKVIEYLKDKKCEFVGVSCTTQRIYSDVRDLVRKIRAEFPDVHITMGGVFPSIEFKNILRDIPELDTVIIGEGEYALFELSESIRQDKDNFDIIKGLAYRDKGEILVNPPNRITDISDLPFPRRDSLEFEHYQKKFLRIIAGRGCYGKCAFCSISTSKPTGHEGRIYRRPENVVLELQELVQKYSISYFTFSDDIFYDRSARGRNWVSEFTDKVKKSNLDIKFRIELRVNDVTENEINLLKQVGLDCVFLGIESGVERILKEMRKNATVEDIFSALEILRRYDIEVNYGYIAIIPTMSYEELKSSYDFLFRLGGYSESNLYSKLILFSGCEYENILRNQGLLLPKKDFWERKNYKYKDPKVELFSKCLENTKQLMAPSKEVFKAAKGKFIRDKRPDEYLSFQKANINCWESIIKSLMHTIDNESVCTIDDITSLIQDEIKKIEQLTNNLCKKANLASN